MGPAIHLLGTPRILLDGVPAPALRGHKAWGLLAWLIRHPAGASRSQLAALLFEDAEDPLAALRWNLAQLRPALGGLPLRGALVRIPPECAGYVDVDVLSRGDAIDALDVPGLGRDLLEGLRFGGSPSFEVWLESERRQMHALTQAVLREAALARLATGAADEAARLASRLVGLDPLNEGFQVLLVRCLATAGDGVGAARQAAACRALFARELGVVPGPALSAALDTSTATPIAQPVGGRAGATAQLEAGEAAIGAGVLEAGLQCLRRAIVESDASGDPELRARSRVALGAALVHASRGRDDEGAAALHGALAIGRLASPRWAAAASRELGYVDFLRGSYARARVWLRRADELGGADPAEKARIATVNGSIFSDTARYVRSVEVLAGAVALAQTLGDVRQAAYALSMLGRAEMLRGNHDAAASALERAADLARRSWTAFLPWPESFLAEIDLHRGRLDEAAERFEHAFALGCQLGDPCWEGIARRGLGKVAAARGDRARAVDVLVDAVARSVRLPDAYLWGKAYALDALCALAVTQAHPQAGAWVEELASLSARTGMRELNVRALLHRGRLGYASSLAVARVLAQGIDNPVLMREVEVA